MRNYMLMACVVLAFGACKKDKWEQAVSDMEGFRDKMCACKDQKDPKAQKDCADGVEKSMKDWEKGMEDKFGKDDKPPEKLMERGDKVEKDMRECRKAIRKAGEAAAGGDMIKKMGEFKDAMCACKEGDKDCASKVQKDMQDYAQANAAGMGDKMSDEDMKKATDIGMEMAKCAGKAMGAGSATP